MTSSDNTIKSLLECQVSSLANIGYNFLLAKEEGTRWGTQHNSIVPYQVCPGLPIDSCTDGRPLIH